VSNPAAPRETLLRGHCHQRSRPSINPHKSSGLCDLSPHNRQPVEPAIHRNGRRYFPVFLAAIRHLGPHCRRVIGIARESHQQPVNMPPRPHALHNFLPQITALLEMHRVRLLRFLRQ